MTYTRAILKIDPTDPEAWGQTVEHVAEKMAERMWGAPAWYRGCANDVLSELFGLDPKDTQRVLWEWDAIDGRMG